MRIEPDDLTRPQVLALLNEHLANMYELSPPESVHALDVSKLRAPGITFWTVWEGDELLGCGALKELAPGHGEVKSMRTPKALRRRGAGRAMLVHIIDVARVSPDRPQDQIVPGTEPEAAILARRQPFEGVRVEVRRSFAAHYSRPAATSSRIHGMTSSSIVSSEVVAS